MFRYRLFRLLLTLWVGCLLTICCLVVPYLFNLLPKEVAGTIAPHLFASEAIIGLIIGLLLFFISFTFEIHQVIYRRLRIIIGLMILLTFFSYVLPAHFMNEWRMLAAAQSQDVMNSIYASRFTLIHNIASVFYLVKIILGVTLVWYLPPSIEYCFYTRG